LLGMVCLVLHFLPCDVMHSAAIAGMRRPSVCLSVRPSVCLSVCLSVLFIKTALLKNKIITIFVKLVHKSFVS